MLLWCAPTDSIRSPEVFRVRQGSSKSEPNVPRTGDRDDRCPLEPVTQQFIDDLVAAGGPPVYTLSPAAARALLLRQQSVRIAKPDAHIEDATFPVGLKGAIRVRIARPKDSERLVPVIMHFHGGGWVLGDVNTHDRLIRDIAVCARVAVVFVDYDRAPEVQFPIPLEEAYAATKYVAENGSTLNVDSSRLAVVGDSAGGNIATAVTLLSKERRGTKISFQLLFYPVTDANFEIGSYPVLMGDHMPKADLTRDANKIVIRSQRRSEELLEWMTRFTSIFEPSPPSDLPDRNRGGAASD